MVRSSVALRTGGAGALALAAALLAAPGVAQEPPTADLGPLLAAAVDAATPALRLKAADELARRPGISVDAWRAACAGFGTFAALEPGPNHHRVELQVLDQVEPTDLYLYVPKAYEPTKPAPLLLWGHGAGGTGAREHLHWQQHAERLGMLILAPSEAGSEPGYAFSEREREAQHAALRWARRRANIDENSIFVGGASRGGHLTWDLILRTPDRWAGALPCIGGPRLQIGAQNNLRYLENVVHLPIRDLQGSHDDPLLLQNLRLCCERLRAAGAKDCELIEFADRGHDFDLAAVDWQQFFARRRQPVPARVERMAARADEAQSFWLEILAFERGVAEAFTPKVDAKAWDRLDETGRRLLLLDQVREHTARLRVVHEGGGRFTAEGRGVRKFRLLLDPTQVGADGSVEVRWAGKTVRKRPPPSAQVLLRAFAERCDRTFLPIAEVIVP